MIKKRENFNIYVKVQQIRLLPRVQALARRVILLELCKIIFDKQKIKPLPLYFAKNHLKKFLKSLFLPQF
jgi:hypothetical protein